VRLLRPRAGVAPLEVLALVAITVVPLLLGADGRVNADTKQYLYLDPLGLLDRARVLWDAKVGGGTVTHQAIGYLWPMGPWFAATDALGIPAWAAQRLWVGGLQLSAALGALVLFRHLLPRHPVQLAAAAAYGLSPFALGHVTGQSGLLVPFAALGWMVWAMARAVDAGGGWRWPAVFALVVTTAGSLNGSSLFFAVLAAVLWVPAAVATRAGTDARAAIGVLVRAGALTLLCQLWWLVAYAVGGRYGLPILSVTENVQTTNATTSATEVLRGLGYWFFYGSDAEGQWLRDIAPPYLASGSLLVLTFAVPIGALALGAAVRWPPRAYFATLVGVGTVVAVGAFPEPVRSPAGAAFEALSRRSDLVLSLRNTQRAGALVALGLAGLAAGGLTALARRNPRAGAGAALALGTLAAVALPAQWRTGLIAERFHRPADVPAAWSEAGEHLDEGEGRVLEVPGIDFASYRWGHTLDPVSVGLTDRPVLARELVPMGGPAGVSVLSALDRSLHEGWFEPEALAPVARLLGAADVLVRNDLEHERYRTVRPAVAWPALAGPSAGLGRPVVFGDGYRNRAGPGRPMIDEIELGLRHAGADPDPALPQVAVLPVPGGGREPLSALAHGAGVVVDGDGEGVVAAAAAGLLDDPDGPVLLAADLLSPADRLERSVGPGTRYVLTDSNRKRAQRWYALRENVGATEPATSALVLDDPSDARLVMAGEDRLESRTVVEWQGAQRVWATAYGTPFTLLPEERPSNAFDGDDGTAWRVEIGPTRPPYRIGIDAGRDLDADHVVLVPPQQRPGTVAVTRVAVTLDGRRRVVVDADEAQARDPAGLRVDLDGAPFERLAVEILETAPARGPAGFAEVRVPGLAVDEVVVLPTGLLDRLGPGFDEVPLAVALTRLRADPAEPVRADPEPTIRRRVHLPGPVALQVGGTARLAPGAPEPTLDGLLGAGDGTWAATARSSEHLPGSVHARASSAFDGERSTAWSTPLVGVTNQWLELDLSEGAMLLSELEVGVVADEHHSTPTRLLLELDGGAPVDLAVPPVEPGPPGTVRTVTLPLPQPLGGSRLRVTVLEVDPRTSPDWYTAEPATLPVAIAGIATPGAPLRPPAAPVDTGCRDDLLRVGGQAVPLRVTGPTTSAERYPALDVEACGEPLVLGPGPVEIETAPGLETGVHLDRLVLRNQAWDAAPTTVESGTGRPPRVEVTSSGAASARATITSTDGEPFWLLLDQSVNDGWELRIDGATVDGPRPLDAYAAGWLVEPDGPGELVASVRWGPQRTATLALWASGIGVLLTLVLALWPRRDRVPPPSVVAPELVRALPAPTRVAVGLATVTAAVVVHPLAAIPAWGAMAAARRWPLAGRWLPVALVAASMATVVVSQLRSRHTADFDWPREVGTWHGLALLGVVILAIGAADEALARRGPPPELLANLTGWVGRVRRRVRLPRL
jgi:arabinofuranan 3-O-arabinosyltransferase